MKTKTAKILAVVLILIVTMSVLSACKDKGSGIPDGRYVPVDSSVAVAMQAIVINGNNFTVVHGSGLGFTAKYKYQDGTITITDGTGGNSLPCTYEDGSLWYADVEFVIDK